MDGSKRLKDQINSFTNVIRSPILHHAANTSASKVNNNDAINNVTASSSSSTSSNRPDLNRVFTRENVINRQLGQRGLGKNRHTIAEAINDNNYEIIYTSSGNSPTTSASSPKQSTYTDSTTTSSSGLSKTPDDNWNALSESAAAIAKKKQQQKRDTTVVVVGNISSGVGTGSIGTLGDSDHDLFESSATGLSSNGLDEDESGEELDSYSINNNNNNPTSSINQTSLNQMNLNSNSSYNNNEDLDDHTTKRLKTFVATTLHNELIYLDKLSKLLSFKSYLEDNFNGSLADINVLFSGIPQIYTTHDIVASKLQEYFNSLNDLLIVNADSFKNKLYNQPSNYSSKQQQQQQSSSANLMKEQFLSNALQLLANIMEISFPVYLEFLKNYPKSMTILNKLENPTSNLVLNNSNSKNTSNLTNSTKSKSFNDCQYEFNNLIQQNDYYTYLNKSENNNLKDKKVQLSRTTAVGNTNSNSKNSPSKDPYSIYYNDVNRKVQEKFDLTKIFAEEILRRPTKLFEFIYSLKEECLMASNELNNNNYSHSLQANIKSLFDNEASKTLREKVFDEINRNIMPKEVRKNEDVVELIESSNEKRIRHLILYGDCLLCCKTKKEKRHLKWFIPIDQLEIRLDEYKSDKSENDQRYLRNLREEVLSLRRRQIEDNSSRNQQKIKKKLAEQENELTIQSSRLKLIVRLNPSLASQSSSSFTSNTSPSNNHYTSTNTIGSTATSLLNTAAHSISASMSNLTNLSSQKYSSTSNYHHNHHHNHHHSNLVSANNNISNSSNNMNYNNNNNSINYVNNSSNQYIILFTSDYERIAWLEEINGAIYAFKARKTTVNLQLSDLEARINSLKKVEEPPKAVTSSCTGSLELLIKHIDELNQPNKLFVAVEVKSCGSYLQVAETQCTDITTNPIWNEKFNLELQCVDSLRIVLYCQTSDKALAISSQELKVDSSVNLNKINCVKLDNSITIHLSMKFLSPKKTITRRKTRNRNDIFGGNLSDLLQREKSSIPRILKDCVEVIEGKGINEVGIYRVSSVVSEVQKMKDLYSKNPNQALNELRLKSPHLSANVLKLYLRELPDPLFTSDLYHRFMSALDLLPDFRMSELCRVFNDLPEQNRTIILFVLTHLLNIASHSDKNMMGLQNLCTLFGPTLMKLSPKDNLQVEDMAKEIKESMQQAQVLFYILQLHSDDRLIPDKNSSENEQSSITNSNLNSITKSAKHTDIRNINFDNPNTRPMKQSPSTELIDKNNNNSLTKNSNLPLHTSQSSQQPRPNKSNMQTTL